jgi:3-hydroxyacyl-[acyl-carrier-protein] dehydratase
MLLNKLYTIVNFDISENRDKVSAEIKLIGEHPVFEGHFPGNPVLPGVCTVQIIRELLEKAVGQELMLTKAANIKYLGFISPAATPLLQFNLAFSPLLPIMCSAGVSANGIVLCSMKGEYEAMRR